MFLLAPIVQKLYLYVLQKSFFLVFRVWRAVIFVALGLISALPIIHYLIENGISEAFEKGALTNLLSMGALYITGAGLYAARIPERWLPGKGDIWFQSHQIFHLLVSHNSKILTNLNFPPKQKSPFSKKH